MVQRVFPGFDGVAPIVDELLSSPEGRQARLDSIEDRRRCGAGRRRQRSPRPRPDDGTRCRRRGAGPRHRRRVAGAARFLGSRRRTGCYRRHHRDRRLTDHTETMKGTDMDLLAGVNHIAVHDRRPRPLRRVLHQRVRSRRRLRRDHAGVPTRHHPHGTELVAPPRRDGEQPLRDSITGHVPTRPPRPPRPHRDVAGSLRSDQQPTRRDEGRPTARSTISAPSTASGSRTRTACAAKSSSSSTTASRTSTPPARCNQQPDSGHVAHSDKSE